MTVPIADQITCCEFKNVTNHFNRQKKWSIFCAAWAWRPAAVARRRKLYRDSPVRDTPVNASLRRRLMVVVVVVERLIVLNIANIWKLFRL